MDARICLLVVAIINLSNFSLGIAILSDIVFQCKPRTFTFDSFIYHLGTIRSRHWSWIFIRVGLLISLWTWICLSHTIDWLLLCCLHLLSDSQFICLCGCYIHLFHFRFPGDIFTKWHSCEAVSDDIGQCYWQIEIFQPQESCDISFFWF